MSKITTIQRGDMRHNRNCYAYLQQLIPFIGQDVLKHFPKLNYLLSLNGTSYNEQTAYGNYYGNALSYIEECIDSVYPNIKKNQLKSIDDFIFTIYHNNNHILEDGKWLNDLNQQIRPQHSNAERLIIQHLEDSAPAINKKTPNKESNNINLFFSLFTPNFKPQLTTNIPSIRNRSYNSELASTEYRFSTQAQRHQGDVRVSPLFKHWLAISAKRTPATQAINHIYFNNLGLDRSALDIPGTNEKALTNALHKLEQDSSLKIAVITLPASHGLMDSELYKKTSGELIYSKIFREFFTIASREDHPSGIVDFKISPKIRALLFDNNLNQTKELNRLLKNSFTRMGFKPGDFLSEAQKQAVWLHFIKFELINFIVYQLNPSSYNFSCKDAIDRGTVSSLYFNLMQSFSSNQPMNRVEFERDLDIPAANVKGRGINFHRRILWNAIDCYANAHYDELVNNNKKSWLIYWRDMNCPHARVPHLLSQRLDQFEKQLKHLSKSQIIITGVSLLKAIKELHEQKVNGQRLLLEVVSRSNQFLFEKPTIDSINAYKNLAQELKVKHPKLQILAGLLLGFLGAILFAQFLIDEAKAKINTGLSVNKRNELCNLILHTARTEEEKLEQAPPSLSPRLN